MSNDFVSSTRPSVPDYASVDVGAIVRRVLSAWAPRVLEEVRRRWPSGSGRSREGWRATVVGAGTDQRISVTNDVPYAAHVIARGDASRTPLATTIPAAVLLELGPAMRADVSAAIATAYANAPRVTR